MKRPVWTLRLMRTSLERLRLQCPIRIPTVLDALLEAPLRWSPMLLHGLGRAQVVRSK